MGTLSNSIILGITGGLACGKSEVGKLLTKDGFVVCDADVVAHELMSPGQEPFQRVVDHFGSQILTEDGAISRPRLGKIIFEHPEERAVLNQLVHPAVRASLMDWISEQKKAGLDAAVLLPLLFESQMDDLGWDAVICVSTCNELVFERLKKRGIGYDEAVLRIESQMPLIEKEKRSDWVLSNQDSLSELRKRTQELVRRIKGNV